MKTDTKIEEVVSAHPKLREWLGKVNSALRLGGLTNLNFMVETDSDKYVLRVPGRGTEEYINRAFEKHAAVVTAELGVNAPVLFFDEATGIQLCRFIQGSVTMDAAKFKDLGAIARAAHSFRRVHRSGREFKNRFELFTVMDSYLEYLKEKKARLPDGFFEVKESSEAIRTALNQCKITLAPCHCDPLAENFLDVGNHMFIIDWEYAGNNDPMWDLGDLSVEAGFSAEQDEQLLASYFTTEGVSAFDRGRMVLYKAMCDLLWVLWGVVQHVNQNPAEDFEAYAANRLKRCQALLQTPGFDEHVRIVARGR